LDEPGPGALGAAGVGAGMRSGLNGSLAILGTTIVADAGGKGNRDLSLPHRLQSI
jgi:hypothetical protein